MAKQNRFGEMMNGINAGDRKASIETSAQTKKQPAEAAKKSKKAKYEDKENYKQVGLYLPVELHRKMKIGAAMTDREMSEIAAEGIELWLKENTPNI